LALSRRRAVEPAPISLLQPSPNPRRQLPTLPLPLSIVVVDIRFRCRGVQRDVAGVVGKRESH
jgi:hypothetical protein